MPPVDENSPLERGNRIHKSAEDYITGVAHELAPELAKHLAGQYAALRHWYQKGQATVEEEWCYDFEMKQTGWRDKTTWLRAKLDCCVRLSTTELLVQDLKTGKLFGNEIKHAQQGMFYSGLAAERYPEVEKIHVEFWYADANELTHTTFTRRQAALFLQRFKERGTTMTTAVKFPAKPSESNCRYCPFGKNKGTDVCKHDIFKHAGQKNPAGTSKAASGKPPLWEY